MSAFDASQGSDVVEQHIEVCGGRRAEGAMLASVSEFGPEHER
jgi:hypothetical protein